ncbi:methyltransferase domain-containing protein [Methylomarinum sp. Ch1-1]|uniref:Methyltransferase domain-containing protein n=1 Tax=Methylomarinum roseum TaxID=3067653 RepID=A0AAU7NWZ7_9GAMM|nr:methyltransferase domain-containing protein [Methylomarinum sp. Ch1-1]MDP4522880.1 methyltransferase domain-containing protein [Methylomarinum sp. Ch1-1]
MNDKAMQNKWDAIYRQNNRLPRPAEVLSENAFLLPKQGAALDLACGLGGNALFLAERGLRVQGWDISPIALQVLQRQAELKGLNIQTQAVDLRPDSLPENAFDVIVISRFLDRTLCDAIIASLKSGGLLFYQTYTVDKLTSQGPNNPAYLLQRNELPKLFASLALVYYRENARVGDLAEGARDEARFIGQKIS